MMEPKDFCPMLIDILSRCGVAIVFLPHIGGSFCMERHFMMTIKLFWD